MVKSDRAEDVCVEKVGAFKVAEAVAHAGSCDACCVAEPERDREQERLAADARGIEPRGGHGEMIALSILSKAETVEVAKTGTVYPHGIDPVTNVLRWL